ncbi:MAG TPA: hypothetical protein VGP89_17945 [Candidatus Angelobacter sp.]|jgi:hypothetical protein|nr:hypothetical protein [Candidatus Angelobacter sp.]
MPTKLFESLKWFVRAMFSESGEVSSARCFTAFLILYFSTQDAWYFHRVGHLIDNATLLTQLTVMTAFYVTNKTAAVFDKPGAQK